MKLPILIKINLLTLGSTAGGYNNCSNNKKKFCFHGNNSYSEE